MILSDSILTLKTPNVIIYAEMKYTVVPLILYQPFVSTRDKS